MVSRIQFEVFGKVQGVFFRKYTHAKANDLHLTGFVLNTDEGTVQGIMEGTVEQVSAMKQWLSKEGSPKSKIEKAQFKDLGQGPRQFTVFEIRR
jgi:acylphosphatase